MAPQPAYVVDYDDETKKAVRGTKKSAREKKAPKISQREPDKERRRSKLIEYPPERSARVEKNVEIITEREIKHDRRNSISSNSPKSPRKSGRPPSAHKNQNFPKVKEEQPRHFGIQPAQPTPAQPVLVSSATQPIMAQPIARPRAQTSYTSPYPSRPTSYHAAYSGSYGGGPPLSTSAWANYTPPTNTYTPPTIIAPTQSPSPYAQISNYQYSAAPVYHAPSVPGSDYFGSQASSAPERPMSTRPLSSRFEAPARTASGYGMRDSLPQEQFMSYGTLYHDDGYTSQSENAIARTRNSIRQPSKKKAQTTYDSDYERMPPPPRPAERPERRPSILRRSTHEYADVSPADPYRDDRRTLIRDDPRPRRSSKQRNSVTYDLPDAPQEREHSRTRPPPSHRSSASYDFVDAMGTMTLEPQSNQGRRRSSYYGASAATSGNTTSSAASGLEAKLSAATDYQDDVAGPTPQLTAAALKKQQRRHGGSSRSTKSSASRDESDYRKSATTRTTRSGSGNDDENVTIKVTGRAQVNVGGAFIDCPDGGEIEIKRQQRGIRGGSDRSISEYGPYPGQAQIENDRRSRVDQPTGRSRMSSQHSYTRSTKYFGDNYF